MMSAVESLFHLITNIAYLGAIFVPHAVACSFLYYLSLNWKVFSLHPR